MTRKALVVVGLAAIIAASTGVAFASNTPKQIVRGADGDPVTSSIQSVSSDTSNGDYSEYGSYDDTNEGSQKDFSADSGAAAPAVADETTADGQVQNEASPASDNSVYDDSGTSSAAVRIPFAKYTICQILDQNSGEELSPRVIFGKFFNECYLTLYNDSTLDLCLNPSTGESQTGTYYIDDNIMAVSFGGDRETAFYLIFNDDGDIDYIIVPSGDMLIYFS